MKPVHIITVVLCAGLIAVAVAIFFNPKLTATTSSDGSSPMAHGLLEGQKEPVLQDTSVRRTATIARHDDGHYWARALVNGKTHIKFLVDTGATVIALTRADARKLGLRPDTLDYKWEVRTAGGTTMGADITLDSVRINQVKIKNCQALVIHDGLEQSLLGMSFLRELHSYEFRSGRMIIRQ